MSLPLPPNVKDLRGREFGRLTVREFAGIRNQAAYWLCDCKCGTTGHEVRGKHLTRWEKEGRAISCGCYRADPITRQAARLTMSEEDRRKAAGGESVTPEKPPPKPRSPRQKRILPFTGDTRRAPPPSPPAPTAADSAPVRPPESSGAKTDPTPPVQVARKKVDPPEPHSVWVVITKDRHGGYHVGIRLNKHGNTPIMQSRRQSAPHEARREAQRIFGAHLDWMTGDQAGLHNQPWVVEIAEVRILQSA
jgi:hypothetical protein